MPTGATVCYRGGSATSHIYNETSAVGGAFTNSWALFAPDGTMLASQGVLYPYTLADKNGWDASGPATLSGDGSVSLSAPVTATLQRVRLDWYIPYTIGTTNYVTTDRAYFDISDPPAVTLTASPTSISSGGSSTLSWTATHTTSQSIDHGIGAVAPSGSTSVSPTATTTYTIIGTDGTSTVSASATVAILPPATIPESRTVTLLAPRMACDSVTGRVYLALGRCTYTENWTRTTTGGSDSLAFSGVTGVTPHDVVLCVSGQESGGLPFTTGHALGAPVPASPGAATSNCLAPDGMLALPNEGAVRIAVGGYQRVGTAAPGVTDPRNYALRVTTDQGRTTTDGLNGADDATLAHTDVAGGAYDAGSPSYWGAWGMDRILALQDERMAGHRRGEHTLAPDVRPLDLTSGVSSPPAGYQAVPQDAGRLQRSVLFGATRYAWTHGQHVCVHRFPQFLARGGSGPFSTFHARWNDPAWPGATAPLPKDDSGASITDAQTASSDMGVTVAAMSAPTVGAVDATLAAVPGYPFVGDWQPHWLGPWLSPYSDGTPAVAYGAMEWAGGDGQDRTLTLVAVAKMHRPYPRNSFTWAGSLEDGWCQHTDAEVFTPSATPAVTTGRDFGHHTCVCVTSTTDGGQSWGDLRILQVAGTPVLADTTDARVAACATRGGRLIVCLCTGGVATLYASDDQGSDWVRLGASSDGGLTWA